MSTVISLLNLKGGVGKTVSSINIAYALAEMGKKVLIVDTDSQGNIASSLGFNVDELSDTIANLILEEIEGSAELDQIKKCIRPVGKVEILPANSLLAGVDYRLMNAFGRETILKSIIGKLHGLYDYIIVDCPPSLGLIVINTLTASDYTLIPVEAHYLSFESLRVMLGTIDMVKKKLNPNLQIAGIFLTKYQSRTKLCRSIKEKVGELYGQSIKVFDEYIPYSIKAAEQTLYGESLVNLMPSHPIAMAYQSIAKELIDRDK